MTIRELYEWAKQQGIEDYDIEIQYRDGGGYYDGTDDANFYDIETKHDKKIIIIQKEDKPKGMIGGGYPMKIKVKLKGSDKWVVYKR